MHILILPTDLSYMLQLIQLHSSCSRAYTIVYNLYVALFILYFRRIDKKLYRVYKKKVNRISARYYT